MSRAPPLPCPFKKVINDIIAGVNIAPSATPRGVLGGSAVVIAGLVGVMSRHCPAIIVAQMIIAHPSIAVIVLSIVPPIAAIASSIIVTAIVPSIIVAQMTSSIHPDPSIQPSSHPSSLLLKACARLEGSSS